MTSTRKFRYLSGLIKVDKDLSAVAVIPARGGSKRIPRKNLYPIEGKPMLAWVIETALAAQVFEEIVVSSEDDEILETSVLYGAKPYRRPAELADDVTHVGPVIEEFLKSLSDLPDSICLLYATALLLQPEHLKQAHELLKNESVSSILAISEFESPIQRAYEIREDGSIQMAESEYFNWRSQDLPPRYRDAGCFSWWKLNMTKSQRNFGFVVPKFAAVDIDSPDDLFIASALHRALSLGN
jgi:pseudaminic acid cytidylyltransferase